MLPVAARAVDLGGAPTGDESGIDKALARNKIDTVSPSGTTINLFDYWITKKDDPDAAGNNAPDQVGTNGTTGINQGRQFRFTNGRDDAGVGGNQGSGGSNNINRWTGHDGKGEAGPNYGLVENQLIDGYPRLRSGSPYQILSNKTHEEWGVVSDNYSRSLDYLFDSNLVDGKEAYLGVRGLLQYQNGYYGYDSKKNYAAYNSSTNTFDVYNASGVTGSGTGAGNNGMFFPFDSGDEVFDVTAGGKLAPKQMDQYATNLNHYFGLTMRTRFMQPANGTVEDDQGKEVPMTYHFSGDDDVWVFIDGVLVGDIGGIHNETTLDIDFHSGEVIVGKGKTFEQKITLRKLFLNAKGEQYLDGKFNGDTFSEGTVHMLNFFYLERGNSASNLSLEFNLVETPESGIVKVDQDGQPVEGAGFELYRTDKDYTEPTDKPLASGITDANGNLSLMGENGPVSFDDLYDPKNPDDTTHYLLKEIKVPNGYRSAVADQGGMKLLYTYVDKGVGVITDANGSDANGYIWQNGSHVMTGAKVTAPAAEQIKPQTGNREFTDADLAKGTLFAVVVKRDSGKPIDNEANWHPVTGDPVGGYEVSTGSGLVAAIEAAKKQPMTFTRGKGGLYGLTVDELPGDIFSYYWMIQKMHPNEADKLEDAGYSLSIYYTEGSLEDANADNTLLLNNENFNALFSARAYVADIQNKFFVQKVDESGSPLSGAKFSLYKADQTTKDAKTGKRVLVAGATAYDSVETVAQLTSPVIPGGAEFPSSKKHPLLEGETYYLKETEAPDGYELNETLVPVVVDKTGVHAYAGDVKTVVGEDGKDANRPVDDGVSVRVGVGELVKTLAQYGSNDGIDATLHNVKAILETSAQSGELEKNGLVWSNVEFPTAQDEEKEKYSRPDVLHLAYGNAAPGQLFYEYGPSSHIPDGGNTSTSVSFDSGWGIMRVEQDWDFLQKSVGEKGKGAKYTKLVSKNENGRETPLDITPLFSGSTVVRVSDSQRARLEVTKQVETSEGLDVDAENDAFTFHVKIKPKDGGAVPVQGYLMRVFEADGTTQFEQAYVGGAAGEATAGNGEFDVTLKAGQTFKVYGLATGDAYEVSEPLSLNGLNLMPEGYSFVGVTNRNGVNLKYSPSNNGVSGTIDELDKGGVPVDNALTFTNRRSDAPRIAVGVKKLFVGSSSKKAQFKIHVQPIATEVTSSDGEPAIYDEGSAVEFGKRIFPGDFKVGDNFYTTSSLTAGSAESPGTWSLETEAATLTAADAGVYSFKLWEETPTADNGIEYDKNVYTLRIEVSISTNGAIRPTMTVVDASGKEAAKADSSTPGTPSVTIAFRNRVKQEPETDTPPVTPETSYPPASTSPATTPATTQPPATTTPATTEPPATTSVTPGTAETPSTAETPGTPGTSTTPGTAETPSTSETPGVPGTAETPGTPTKPMPQTNDPTPYVVVGLLAAVGIAVISAGVILEMRARGNERRSK